MKHVFTVIVVGLLGLVGMAAAMSPALLPGVNLTNVSGETVLADQIGKETTVLLVLVRRSSPGGERLLNYLNRLNPQLPAGRVCIVASGADDKLLKTMTERFKNLSNAVWYRDPDEHLMKQLNIRATPVIIGVRNAVASWSVVGMLDEKKMEGTLRGWITP